MGLSALSANNGKGNGKVVPVLNYTLHHGDIKWEWRQNTHS